MERGARKGEHNGGRKERGEREGRVGGGGGGGERRGKGRGRREEGESRAVTRCLANKVSCIKRGLVVVDTRRPAGSAEQDSE